MDEESTGGSRLYEEHEIRHTLSLENDGLSPRAINGVTVTNQDGSPRGPEYAESLQDENVNLRRRLAESEYGFQKRLEKQTDLISKLQDRLKDSKRRMVDMDDAERTASIAAAATAPVKTPCRLRSGSSEVEDGLLNRLLEEQEKNTTLYDANTTIRQELEDVRSANFHLTSDLLRVTQLYDNVRQEMNRQTEEYKKTESTYAAYLSTEHRQMIKMWRSMQQLRQDYLETRSMTTRGLSSMEDEFHRAMKTSANACRRLSLREAYDATVHVLEEIGLPQDSQHRYTEASIEQLVWENIRKMKDSHAHKDEEIRNLHTKKETTELEVRRLQEEVHIFQRERIDMSQERSNLTVQLERRNAELREFETQLASLRKDYNETDAQLKLATQKQQSLENQLEFLHRELTSEQQQRSAAQDERLHLVREKGDLENRTASLTEQVRSLESARRQAEELLKDAKEQLAEMKQDSKERASAMMDLEHRYRDLQSQRIDMETQLKTLQKMLDISQETEHDLKRQLEQTVAQKEASQGQLMEMQRKCSELETEKKDLLEIRIKLERERSALKQDLIQCRNNRRKKEEWIRAADKERAALDKAVTAIEKENTELHRAVSQLQAQVSKMEQTHAQRLSEIAQRHKTDLETELCQLRMERDDALRQLDHLEKIYKQKLKALEDQIARLKEQLRQETRRRHEYFSRAIRQSQDVAHLRANLDHSLTSLRNEPLLDSLLLPGPSRGISFPPARPDIRSRLVTSAERSSQSENVHK